MTTEDEVRSRFLNDAFKRGENSLAVQVARIEQEMADRAAARKIEAQAEQEKIDILQLALADIIILCENVRLAPEYTVGEVRLKAIAALKETQPG